jgi:phosphoenolpyruvate synthase/pyruvate phosphate dikinase
VGVFTELDYECFLAGISTVSGQMQLDKINMTKAEFLIRYGHLRPGTYDILSPRYDEAPDLYFDWEQQASAGSGSVETFLPTPEQLSEIDSLLRRHKIDVNALELITFMRSAIEQRELAKFEFTHNLSEALSLITKTGVRNGISTEDIAYCDYGVFRELQASEIPIKPYLEKNIGHGKARYSETLKISLPPLISRPEDILAFEWPEMSPSFITRERVTALVVSIDCVDRLEGSIVCIPNADPGFDWLFSHSIAGLITAWGGTNSHMAIRASEQRLPAVIGVGELLYQNWARAKLLRIDCGAQRVEVLK